MYISRENQNRDKNYRKNQIQIMELKNITGDMKKITAEVQKHISTGKGK